MGVGVNLYLKLSIVGAICPK